MADKYELDVIVSTVFRLTGQEFTEAAMKNELEAVVFVPDLDRMIAVADKQQDLATSERYGVFEGMTRKNEYKISTGTAPFARLLTPAEIAKCF